MLLFCFTNCSGRSTDVSEQNKKSHIITEQKELKFFTKNFLKQNDTSEVIFFFTSCIEPTLNTNFIFEKISKSIEGQECSYIDALKSSNRLTLIYLMDSTLYAARPISYEQFYKRFEVWKADDSFLLSFSNNIKSISNEFFLEETLYKYPKTKEFYAPFLLNKAQYWGSLAPSDFCKIYNKVIQWLNTTSPKDRSAFYKYIYKTGLKFSSKKPK